MEVSMKLRLQHAAMAVALVGLLAGPADAASKRSGISADGYQWVTAVSAFYGEAKKISAPTRPGQWGREVRLPGGTWLDCAGDCRQTLADATIDFWDRQNERDNFRRRN
jgi:hypothetical protein